jgi:HlyD family secretion protein
LNVKKKKKIILSAVGLVVILIIAAGIKGKNKKKGDQTTKVRIESVQVGEFVEIINAPGEIRPETEVDISAKVSARIDELPFDEGDRVTGGGEDSKPSLLVRLDSKNFESQLRSAIASRDAQKARIEVEKSNILSQKATLEGTDASLKRTEREFERQKTLLGSQDISQSAFDEVESNLKQLQAQHEAADHSIRAAELNLTVMEHNLTAAEARVEEAREALSYTTMYSPIDGVITQLNAEVGEVVMTGTMNNPGTVILQVADLSRMMLLAEVDETNIGQVQIGQAAKIHIPAFWEEEFDGVVQNIALTQREILQDRNPDRRRCRETVFGTDGRCGHRNQSASRCDQGPQPSGARPSTGYPPTGYHSRQSRRRSKENTNRSRLSPSGRQDGSHTGSDRPQRSDPYAHPRGCECR